MLTDIPGKILFSLSKFQVSPDKGNLENVLSSESPPRPNNDSSLRWGYEGAPNSLFSCSSQLLLVFTWMQLLVHNVTLQLKRGVWKRQVKMLLPYSPYQDLAVFLEQMLQACSWHFQLIFCRLYAHEMFPPRDFVCTHMCTVVCIHGSPFIHHSSIGYSLQEDNSRIRLGSVPRFNSNGAWASSGPEFRL